MGRFNGSDAQGKQSGHKTSTKEVEVEPRRMGDIGKAL